MRFGISDLQDNLDSSDEEDRFTAFSSSSSNHTFSSASDQDNIDDDDDDDGVGQSSFLDDYLSKPSGSSTPNQNVGMKSRRGNRGVSEQPLGRTERRMSSGRYGLNVRRLPSDSEHKNEGTETTDDRNRDPLSPLNASHLHTRRKSSHPSRPIQYTATIKNNKRHVSQPLLSPSKARHLPAHRPKGKGKEIDEDKVKLMVEIDEWDRWDMISRETALRKAHNQNTILNTSLLSSSNNAVHSRLRENSIKEREELEVVQKMLNELEVGRKEEERKKKEEFQRRTKGLWDSIESSIKSAEDIERKRLIEIQRTAEEERRKAEEEQRQALSKQQEAERLAQAAAEKKALDAMESQRRETEAKEAAVQARADAQRLQEGSEQESLAEGMMDGLSPKRIEWEEWVEQMIEVKENVILRLNGDQEAKKSLNKVKRAITVRIGQVVNTRESILGITENIHQHLCANLPAIPTAQQPTLTSIPSLPLGYAYLLSHIAKALLKQAEAEINAKPEAAYPLAKITVGLMLRGHVAFGRILFARIVKKCCWAVPYYPAKQEGQSEAMYMKSVGHKELSPPETDLQYASRMAGILTLYFAICSVSFVTILPTVPSPPATPTELENLIPSPFRISACWSWLAGILRPTLSGLRPIPDFVRVALETMGGKLVEAYGVRQVGKIVAAIWQEGLGVGGDEHGTMSKENVAGKASLRLFLQSFVDTGKFSANEAAGWET